MSEYISSDLDQPDNQDSQSEQRRESMMPISRLAVTLGLSFVMGTGALAGGSVLLSKVFGSPRVINFVPDRSMSNEVLRLPHLSNVVDLSETVIPDEVCEFEIPNELRLEMQFNQNPNILEVKDTYNNTIVSSQLYSTVHNVDRGRALLAVGIGSSPTYDVFIKHNSERVREYRSIGIGRILTNFGFNSYESFRTYLNYEDEVCTIPTGIIVQYGFGTGIELPDNPEKVLLGIYFDFDSEVAFPIIAHNTSNDQEE